MMKIETEALRPIPLKRMKLLEINYEKNLRNIEKLTD